jgi:hypothetical protein
MGASAAARTCHPHWCPQHQTLYSAAKGQPLLLRQAVQVAPLQGVLGRFAVFRSQGHGLVQQQTQLPGAFQPKLPQSLTQRLQKAC